MRKKRSLVVIGNGMVGQNFLTSLMANPGKDNFHITTFCEEPRPAYDRVHLSEFFSGKTAADLSLVEDGFFADNNITIHLGDKAATIDRANKTVTSAKGVTIAYDKLVLATGSYPFVPPVPGHDRKHCLVYRTIEDLEAMKTAALTSKVGVVVGGGLLGLEAAKALTDLGLETQAISKGNFSPFPFWLDSFTTFAIISLKFLKNVFWGPEIYKYFWRFKNRIVGPLSGNLISGSGLFFRRRKSRKERSSL